MKPIRILLADDLTKVRSAMRLFLENVPQMCVVGEATQSTDLLDQAETSQPDLILIDWELPGPLATNLLPALRYCCPRVKVIALSAWPEARQRALAAGVDGFVSKIDPPNVLLTALHVFSGSSGCDYSRN